ncbi:PP2C family protein-serine/threonine phosphatase [Saccharomonospora azurea]|uniref:PP2C family protein-serine/threonine phosphatase n=1 Tax=Saccharomonospora azurea TaxID=40988 RepID=UPI0020D21984|nr:PP2C family protein-serine/threonine phosphatase [Saccharomonospora azurea]
MQSDLWWQVVADVVGETHSASGLDIAEVADRAMHRLGITAELYLSKRGQTALVPLLVNGHREPVSIEGTLPGRAFQYMRPTWSSPEGGGAKLWLPMVNGTERIGVVCFGLPDGLSPEDGEVRERCAVLAGLFGHIIATKFVYGDFLHVTRRTVPFTAEAELLWQLLPPLTYASRDMVISVTLEPCERVGGDAFDYAIDGEQAFCALFDAVGHDMQSGLTAAVALAAIRSARRRGVCELPEMARIADEAIIANRPSSARFVTAFLAWFEPATGELTYLVAGHPPPLLLRADKTVKELEPTRRVPLGFTDSPTVQPRRKRLEPGDRLLLFTDGIPEARGRDGELFGIRRFREFALEALTSGLPAPETLRRLMHRFLRYQDGQIQDDATMMLVDWRPSPAMRPLGPAQARNVDPLPP